MELTTDQTYGPFDRDRQYNMVITGAELERLYALSHFYEGGQVDKAFRLPRRLCQEIDLKLLGLGFGAVSEPQINSMRKRMGRREVT